MNCARARGRYLAALGLTTALGCHGNEPTPTSAATVTVESAAPGTASAPATKAPGARAEHHTAPWVPTVPSGDAEPLKPHPGIAVCPHGPFCVPQPVASGASPTAAPDQTCPATVPLPAGIGPTAATGRQPGVTYDATRTATERESDASACCYQWHVLCVGGRALHGPAGPVTAEATRRGDWLAPRDVVEGLTPAVRDALAAHWEREAAFEHASVGAFARASLALLAVAAPPDLVAATSAAAIDEVEHARLAYGLATAYGGSERGPGPLPMPSMEAAGSLSSLTAETFLDGCAGEAVAALALREAAAAAQDEGLCAILTRIAEDEERHAELAWRTVAWALRAGGEATKRALVEATATLREELATAAPAEVPAGPDLAAHGVLDEGARRAVRRRALAEVVLPCAEALLTAA